MRLLATLTAAIALGISIPAGVYFEVVHRQHVRQADVARRAADERQRAAERAAAEAARQKVAEQVTIERRNAQIAAEDAAWRAANDRAARRHARYVAVQQHKTEAAAAAQEAAVQRQADAETRHSTACSRGLATDC
jgi:hypothetical protein